MDDKYFEVSTMYCLGCVLAYQRILLLEGIYSQIQQLIPGLGIFLKEKLNNMGTIIDNSSSTISLYRYHRLLLAESVMERENDRTITCSYLKFKQQYEENNLKMKSALLPVKDWVSSLDGSEVYPLMEGLSEIASKITKVTRIDSGIREDG